MYTDIHVHGPEGGREIRTTKETDR